MPSEVNLLLLCMINFLVLHYVQNCSDDNLAIVSSIEKSSIICYTVRIKGIAHRKFILYGLLADIL